MNHLNRKLFLVMLAVLALTFSLSLTACSDDDDNNNPTDPGGGGDEPAGDTTAPILLSTNPEAESTGLSEGEVISVQFSEDLDPDSLDGNITLSTGVITNLVLVGGSEVEIRHENWNLGDEVTVTFAVGLADTAGNHLAEEMSLRYWVISDQLAVLETTPADGSVDALRNAPVYIKFNMDMMVSTLETGITAAIPGKGNLTFSITGAGNSRYAVNFNDTIPEDTHVMFTIGTDCESWDGDNLASEYTFSFDTGVDLDETAPELVSISPASGSVIPSNTNTIQFTFNEPIAEDRLQIVRGDLVTFLAMELAEVYGGWNVDHTVMTFTLAGPLAAGCEMTLQLGEFSDFAGNFNDTHPTWNVTVEGTADHYPVEERIVHIFLNTEENGDGEIHEYEEVFHVEWGLDENFKRKSYDMELGVWNEWDNLIRTSNAIQLSGFREFRDGVGEDTIFDSPVQILNHPTVTAAWSGSVEVTTGSNVMDVTFDGEVLPDVSDFPVRFGGKSQFLHLNNISKPGAGEEPEIFWANCRLVAQEIEGRVGGDLLFTQTDTLVYCPGFGLIKEMNHEYQHESVREYHTTSDLVGLEFFED